MLVGIDSPDNNNFIGWQKARRLLPVQKSELFVARDTAMLASWDNYGYEIPDDNEGPLSIIYEPSRAQTFSAQVTSDPYGDTVRFNFMPFEVAFTGPGLTFVTLVTPDRDDKFSTDAYKTLISSFL